MCPPGTASILLTVDFGTNSLTTCDTRYHSKVFGFLATVHVLTPGIAGLAGCKIIQILSRTRLNA
jgi:hypothetical protein